jgi:hypothetical protein
LRYRGFGCDGSGERSASGAGEKLFQAAAPYADDIHLCSDVAIVYGIDAGMPERVKTWRERGYRVHVMTGVSWGNIMIIFTGA